MQVVYSFSFHGFKLLLTSRMFHITCVQTVTVCAKKQKHVYLWWDKNDLDYVLGLLMLLDEMLFITRGFYLGRMSREQLSTQLMCHKPDQYVQFQSLAAN